MNLEDIKTLDDVREAREEIEQAIENLQEKRKEAQEAWRDSADIKALEKAIARYAMWYRQLQDICTHGGREDPPAWNPCEFCAYPMEEKHLR